MSSYRRFISYMYDYHHGQKGKNCGFIKVEIRNDRCIIHFQLKNVSYQEKCNIYLYCQENDPEYVFLQEIPVKNGIINYRLETDSVHVNAYCKGLLCSDENGNDCGTCWDGECLPEYRPQKQVQETEPVHEIAGTQTACTEHNDENHEPSSTAEKSEDCEASPDSQGTVQSPRPFSQLWEHMQKEFPSMDPFEDHAIVETIRITPSDLGYLQASHLNLGTNQFLLHGYKSYQHLLLGRLHGQMQYVLGIPGIYDPQEQFIAKMFGFTCFKPIHECRQKNGQFGYWLRCFN